MHYYKCTTKHYVTVCVGSCAIYYLLNLHVRTSFVIKLLLLCMCVCMYVCMHACVCVTNCAGAHWHLRKATKPNQGIARASAAHDPIIMAFQICSGPPD